MTTVAATGAGLTIVPRHVLGHQPAVVLGAARDVQAVALDHEGQLQAGSFPAAPPPPLPGLATASSR